MTWYFQLLQWIFTRWGITEPPEEPVKPIQEPPQASPAPVEPPKYLWDSVANIRHSVRLICDEENLTFRQKNDLTATVQAESGFNLRAVNYNYAFKQNGTKYVSSTDRGLCQWNDYFHGKEITPDEAFNNPEKCVRLMCQYWKRGQMNQWCAYSSGSYKAFLV